MDYRAKFALDFSINRTVLKISMDMRTVFVILF